MIELRENTLQFRFPEVHPRAGVTLSLQRTLRLPDDGQRYPLPPGLGEFRLRHVDDYAGQVPQTWLRHGGVMLPIYQAEAMWLSFRGDYPCAVMVGSGKLNAVTGEPWAEALSASPQNYLVTPDQPWLDGFVVTRGEVRQFVAMPLGAGYTAEEQLSGEAVHGGVQIAVCPMRRDVFEAFDAERVEQVLPLLCCGVAEESTGYEMGLAPGGRMHQEVYADEHGIDAWQHSARSRCFVHLADSLSWLRITGEPPPMRPPAAADYTAAGLPWFEWYDDEHRALAATPEMQRLRGLASLHRHLAGEPAPEEPSAMPHRVVPLGSSRRFRVREPDERTASSRGN